MTTESYHAEHADSMAETERGGDDERRAFYLSTGDSPRPGQQGGINNPRPNALNEGELEDRPPDNPTRELEITGAKTEGVRQPC
eukprot:3144295-Pyramimonas_sp.AAC.1